MDTPIFRGSERRSLKRCPQRWWWDWREGLVPRREPLGPLWFGSIVHVALARWYTGPGKRRGVEPVETWMQLTKDAIAYVKTMTDLGDEERIAQHEDARELGAAMLAGYREKYGRDEHMHVISPEQTFSLEVPWPAGQTLYEAEAGSIMAIFAGTFDLVYRDLTEDILLLGETKTAKSVSTRHLTLDDQAGGYWAIADRTLRAQGLLKKGDVLRGIEYNFLRKGRPDDRPRDAEGYFVNKPLKADYVAVLSDLVAAHSVPTLAKLSLPALQEMAAGYGAVVLGDRSKVQPAPLFERHRVHRTSAERRTQLLRIQQDGLLLQAYRDGILPLTKNPTTDCTWDCSFFDMCELQERGGNWEDFRDMKFRAEDPYADHRKSAAE